MLRAATLDLGSTSFNLLIADATPGGEIRPVVQEKVMLRLGAAIASNAKIPEEMCERAVAVGRALCEVARREKVELLLPVGTAALREARNGGEVAARIGSAIGTPVRILSGEEEAARDLPGAPGPPGFRGRAGARPRPRRRRASSSPWAATRGASSGRRPCPSASCASTGAT